MKQGDEPILATGPSPGKRGGESGFASGTLTADGRGLDEPRWRAPGRGSGSGESGRCRPLRRPPTRRTDNGSTPGRLIPAPGPAGGAWGHAGVDPVFETSCSFRCLARLTSGSESRCRAAGKRGFLSFWSMRIQDPEATARGPGQRSPMSGMVAQEWNRCRRAVGMGQAIEAAYTWRPLSTEIRCLYRSRQPVSDGALPPGFRRRGRELGCSFPLRGTRRIPLPCRIEDIPALPDRAVWRDPPRRGCAGARGARLQDRHPQQRPALLRSQGLRRGCPGESFVDL